MPSGESNWQRPELVVDVELAGDRTRVLVARGEIDVSTAQVLEDAFRAEAETAGVVTAARVVLDLTGVGFIDSTAMGVMAEWRDRIVDAGGAFALVTDNPHQIRLFRLTELSERLRLTASREKAIAAVEDKERVD